MLKNGGFVSLLKSSVLSQLKTAVLSSSHPESEVMTNWDVPVETEKLTQPQYSYNSMLSKTNEAYEIAFPFYFAVIHCMIWWLKLKRQQRGHTYLLALDLVCLVASDGNSNFPTVATFADHGHTWGTGTRVTQKCTRVITVLTSTRLTTHLMAQHKALTPSMAYYQFMRTAIWKGLAN